MALVDFFIAGVQKSGTTALDAHLRRHPRIQMADKKELHHFDNEKIDWSNPPHEQLHSHFDWAAQGLLRGEATPIYTYWPSSPGRLQRYNPAAKLIVGIRHPVCRAYSQWRMATKRGWETLTFRDATSCRGRQRVADAPGGCHRAFSYVERGFYADQIRRLFALFPQEQIFFYKTENLWLNPVSTLTMIESFLGVEHVLATHAGSDYVVPIDTREVAAPIPDGDRERLQHLFSDDIAETAHLTRLDLSNWGLSYRDPMDSL